MVISSTGNTTPNLRTVAAVYGAVNNSMKATTCQMSNVCCAMCSVVVKAPNDLLTRRPFLSGRMTSSYGHGVNGFLDKFIGHRTTDIRHLTSCGLRSFFHSSYDRRRVDLTAEPAPFSEASDDASLAHTRRQV